MKYAICFAASLTMSVLVINSWAQQTRPADAAADEERTIKVDLSSPKAAAKTFVEGWFRGDAATMRKAAIADDEQTRFLDEMTSGQAAMKKLEDVAAKKYGPEGKKAFAFSAKVDVLLQSFDSAEETITGDSATVRWSKNPDLFPVRKVGGDWKVNVADLAQWTRRKDVAPALSQSKKLADDLAADIEASKFATAADAKVAYDQRFNATTYTTVNSPPPPVKKAGAGEGEGKK